VNTIDLEAKPGIPACVAGWAERTLPDHDPALQPYSGTLTIRASGPTLTQVSEPARPSPPAVIGDVPDVCGSPAQTGSPPARHRPDRGVLRPPHDLSVVQCGDRRLNHAIHMAAVTQMRYQHSNGTPATSASWPRERHPAKSARPQEQDQQRHLRGPCRRRTPRSRNHQHNGPERATSYSSTLIRPRHRLRAPPEAGHGQ
jgi:hypothetical protein